MGRDTKQRLLQQGLTSFMTKGFNHTGIQEVLQAVGVPKGSFYHYFKSKNDFGKQVVQFYSCEMLAQTREHFQDPERTPLERFHAFFQDARDKMGQCGYSGGCFLGNMCQEMGDLCHDFESMLEGNMHHMGEIFVACIMEGQDAGEIRRDADPAQLADFLINSWQGALLRMKVAKCSKPLDTFQSVVFSHILC